MTWQHDAHDLDVALDADDLADRRDQARELRADEYYGREPGQVCTCRHDPEDHWPRDGCVRRECLCWWWAP